MKTKFISRPLLYLALFGSCVLQTIAQEHPRIYCSEDEKEAFLQSIAQTDWKSELINQKKENLEKYIELCAEDPEWLLSRLQMNWETKHNKVYLKGGDFSHSEGTAPVPTVRFSGSRDWATNYLSPKLEEVEPYFDDERGMYLKNRTSKKMEWVHPSETGHIIETINRRVMSLVQDAAFLYWISGDEKYAEFAEPVFLKYIEGMYYREPPLDLENGNQQGVSGLATFEVIHEQIVVYLSLSYDFLHQRFEENKVDLDKTVAVFQKWGDQIINKGIPDNNWNLFQARFLTYLALALDHNDCYENGKGQEYYLRNIFELSTERQIALKESILVYDQENGIWPESASYSVHVTTTLLRILTLLDHSTNENELSNFPIIEKATLAAFQYLFPTGYTVSFGDSKHSILPPENFELLISNYRKYDQKEKELLISGVLHNLIQEEKYSRGFRDLFPLFFYVDKLEFDHTKDEAELYASLTTPTFYAPNVSLFIQRMGEKKNATMVSTAASWGNHSHVNGISMELFANGYVLAPDMGRGSSYWHPDYREYYSQFPAHNTVVVDGISTYDRMRGYHPFTLENHYPPNGKSDITFKDVSFSNVSFVEPETMSDQQRLTALINSKSGKGYVVDIFRSRKKVPAEQKHEYFYHNLGQSLAILDSEGQPLKLQSSDELGTIHGDMKAYDYLSHKRSLSTSENIQALFTLESEGQADNLMKMWIKGSEEQKVFTVSSPKPNTLSKGTAPAEVIGQNIPTLVLRKNEEAWNNPFVVVYNPHFSDGNKVISRVSYPDSNQKSGTQFIEIEDEDGEGQGLIIANASENDIAENKDLYMKGLLAIIRKSQQEEDFIFVSGIYKFEYEGWEIVSTSSAVTVSIERNDKGYTIQNDKPVLIRIPISGNSVPGSLEIYENGKMIAKREGIISRHKPDLVEYRLARAYERAIVVSKNID